MSDTQVTVVVTGTAWLGRGVRSIESALEQLFRQVQHEVALTVYSISSGADLLLEWMEDALTRGVLVHMVVNQLDTQPIGTISRLRNLTRTYPHFRLYNFPGEPDADMHAKAVVIDRRVALIGSSNLSRRGLLTNHEIAVLVEGPPALTAAQSVDRLIASRYIVRIDG